MHKYEAERPAPQVLEYSLLSLLAFAFLTGGSSQVVGWDDVAVQLFALPVLAFAMWRLAMLPATAMRSLALVVAGLIAMVPILQLLSLPRGVLELSEARRLLAADLAIAGAALSRRWSLDVQATWQAFLFLLPPLAVFAATLASGPDTHRRVLWLVMWLALFSLLLAFMQIGVPAESLLNPFPRWAHQFNGVFANQNHQGIAMVLAVIIASAGMLASLGRSRVGWQEVWTPWLLGFIALFSLCALPLTGSRASVLIAVFAVAVLPFSLGLFERRRLQHDWRARTSLLACLGLVALGVWSTVRWMQLDAVDELRAPMRAAAATIGNAYAPLGTGVGAFVPAFEQAAPDKLLLPTYVNHAHNEYVQWWMESGWLAVGVGGLVMAILVRAVVRGCWPRETRWIPAAASLGLGALFLHSMVDYPLRTAALATVASALAGVLIASTLPACARRQPVEIGDERGLDQTS